jgi:hypothetical protein
MEFNEIRILSQLAFVKGCRNLVLTIPTDDVGEYTRYTLRVGLSLKDAIIHDLKFLERCKQKCSYLILRYCRKIIKVLQRELLVYDVDQIILKPIIESQRASYNEFHPNIKYHKPSGLYYIHGYLLKKEKIRSDVKPRHCRIGDYITSHLLTTNFQMIELNSIAKMELIDNVVYIQT